MKKIINSIIVMMTITALFLTGCGSVSTGSDSALSVLTSTTFLADITRNIAGDRVNVDSLLPAGTDPHAYQPSPQDMAKIEKSRLIIINGAGYEQFLLSLIAGAEKNVIEASAGLSPREDAEQGVDPHMWLDPNLVISYVENIRKALAEYDPAGEAVYQSNADVYVAQLQELDGWIKMQVEQVPADKRLLVTNHEAFGYFADRYSFEVVGSVVPSFSSNAAPSAQQMAGLIDAIKKLKAPAIFLDTADNNTLAEQIADETGIKVIDDLHLESLTEGAPAATYIDMMKYNVSRIVEALK
ncbi:MAG: zinc ABC transporter substrate-binding protein [Chloroflexi bacterium]|nr:zinc ABC transporter substrate-binding protein [Chloroflexota bacterium]